MARAKSKNNPNSDIMINNSTSIERVFSFRQETGEFSTFQSPDMSKSNDGSRINPSRKYYNGKDRKKMPITTYLFASINIVLFLLYWNNRVDPSTIALDNQVIHDYGRAFTATFGHFEIWHLLFNTVSLLSLGEVLEQQFGSIPFFLYTMAFIPFETLIVLALQRLFTRTSGNRYSSSSMVGFSGILFAWSVELTLSSGQTCPIFLFPDLCFNTYMIFGISVSLGPLVQLCFLQMVLPRVSFIGHLAGIVLGFAWHWNVLPPLELTQPLISYPCIWMIGKVIIVRAFRESRGERFDASLSSNNDGIHHLRIQRLRLMRNVMAIHWVILIYTFGCFHALTISQALMILILSTISHEAHNIEYLGKAGRAFIILLIVVWMTDSMTFTGWWIVLRPVLSMFQTIIASFRFILWYSSLSMICHMLVVTNQIHYDSVWTHICNSLHIIESCKATGTLLVEYQLPSCFLARRSKKVPPALTPDYDNVAEISNVI